MKWNNKLSLALVGTLALSILPALAYEDQNEDGKKESKKEWKKHHHEVQKAAQFQQSGRKERSQSRTDVAASIRIGNASPMESPRAYRSSTRYQGDQHIQQAYVRSKPSRDFWVPENVYHDWDRHSRHYYNHHTYGWNHGAWIIVEPGYAPDYYASDSLVSRVQARLAEKGYYRGPIDGDVGPGTRRAIADYQADHDLRATGHISEGLLESLRLE